ELIDASRNRISLAEIDSQKQRKQEGIHRIRLRARQHRRPGMQAVAGILTGMLPRWARKCKHEPFRRATGPGEGVTLAGTGSIVQMVEKVIPPPVPSVTVRRRPSLLPAA